LDRVANESRLIGALQSSRPKVRPSLFALSRAKGAKGRDVDRDRSRFFDSTSIFATRSTRAQTCTTAGRTRRCTTPAVHSKLPRGDNDTIRDAKCPLLVADAGTFAKMRINFRYVQVYACHNFSWYSTRTFFSLVHRCVRYQAYASTRHLRHFVNVSVYTFFPLSSRSMRRSFSPHRDPSDEAQKAAPFTSLFTMPDDVGSPRDRFVRRVRVVSSFIRTLTYGCSRVAFKSMVDALFAIRERPRYLSLVKSNLTSLNGRAISHALALLSAFRASIDRARSIRPVRERRVEAEEGNRYESADEKSPVPLTVSLEARERVSSSAKANS